MDENRTHQGRLNSAPQTVLKNAVLPSTYVHTGPPRIDRAPEDSRIVRLCPPVSVELAVFLAVSCLRAPARVSRHYSPGRKATRAGCRFAPAPSGAERVTSMAILPRAWPSRK